MIEQFLLNHIATIATVFLTICYLPQIVTTFKTKNVSGMTVSFWVLLNLALFCLLINSIFIFIQFGTWGYMVTEILNFGLAFVMLVLVLKYKKNEKVDKNGI